MKGFRWRPLSRADRQGLYILVGLLLCWVAFRLYGEYGAKEPEETPLTQDEVRELQQFDSAATVATLRDTSGAALFPFNPNTADSLTLRQLGFTLQQVRNLMKYRRAGGRWKDARDFARLYGLSEQQYRRVRPYIVIPSEKKHDAERRAALRRDTLRWKKVEKYPVGTVVDLNAADTTMLKKIPGIGSYYAGKICRYRERLGGFVSVAQLREVEGLPEDIVQWVTVAAAPAVTPLNINRADFRTLVRHPYLSYEQVKAIVVYRQKYGNIRDVRALRQLQVFSDEELQRIMPYLTF